MKRVWGQYDDCKKSICQVSHDSIQNPGKKVRRAILDVSGMYHNSYTSARGKKALLQFCFNGKGIRL